MAGKIAAGLFGVYGLVSLVGGIIGFVVTSNKGEPSYASLIAGGGAGLVLIGCAAAMFSRPVTSLVVGAIVSLALVGWFMAKLLGPVPTGAVPIVMAVGGVICLVGAVAAWRQRSPSGGC